MTRENREKLARCLETTAMILRTDIPDAMGIELNVERIIELIREAASAKDEMSETPIFGYTYDGSGDWSFGFMPDPQDERIAVMRFETDEMAREFLPLFAKVVRTTPSEPPRE